jgi:hypothetical protein
MAEQTLPPELAARIDAQLRKRAGMEALPSPQEQALEEGIEPLDIAEALGGLAVLFGPAAAGMGIATAAPHIARGMKGLKGKIGDILGSLGRSGGEAAGEAAQPMRGKVADLFDRTDYTLSNEKYPEARERLIDWQKDSNEFAQKMTDRWTGDYDEIIKRLDNPPEKASGSHWINELPTGEKYSYGDELSEAIWASLGEEAEGRLTEKMQRIAKERLMRVDPETGKAPQFLKRIRKLAPEIAEGLGVDEERAMKYIKNYVAEYEDFYTKFPDHMQGL